MEPPTCLLTLEEPLTYDEASTMEVWLATMDEEMNAIIKNETWELVEPHVGCKPIGLKWIFKIKRNEGGKVVRYKARIVVKGYVQQHGADYDEVYAPEW